jgi:hypothetical protein
MRSRQKGRRERNSNIEESKRLRGEGIERE